MFTVGGITLFVFVFRFALFTIHESPKLLLGNGKDQEALEMLHKVAEANKGKIQYNLREVCSSVGRINGSPVADE